ncbi:hypothetical protein IE53DRAFT_13644 [Violaceomyces palustris]|uniref:Uncharacterized protein n=1 Tax=Violaceomyces palustris TaxID=1673888 RepID=A0ACD0NLN3_9BASI|nr:hypothetical protein IE53DRAFT_13644 [Violaceomyces palustris]
MCVSSGVREWALPHRLGWLWVVLRCRRGRGRGIGIGNGGEGDREMRLETMESQRNMESRHDGLRQLVLLHHPKSVKSQVRSQREAKRERARERESLSTTESIKLEAAVESNQAFIATSSERRPHRRTRKHDPPKAWSCVCQQKVTALSEARSKMERGGGRAEERVGS